MLHDHAGQHTATAPFAPLEQRPHINDDAVIELAQALLQWLQPTTPFHDCTDLLRRIVGKLDVLCASRSIERPLLVSIHEAARLLALSERFCRGQIARGAWPCYRTGRVVRVDPLEIKALLAKPARRRGR